MAIAIKSLFAASALLAASAGFPAAAVEAFSADYQANYMGIVGAGKMTLAPAGAGKWEYTLNIRSSGASLTQSTVFEDRNGQWRPLSSNDSSLLLIKKVNKKTTYDWACTNGVLDSILVRR